MSKEKTKISIVILTWNGLDDTLEVLKDIEKLEVDGMSAETIVVDNGSTDGTQQKLRNHKLKNMEFKLIETGVNLGFAGGNNVGIRDAYDRGSEYVIVMNNDIALPKDILLKLVSSAKNKTNWAFWRQKCILQKDMSFTRIGTKKIIWER
jgi:GT2 family glycosyltransferase